MTTPKPLAEQVAEDRVCVDSWDHALDRELDRLLRECAPSFLVRAYTRIDKLERDQRPFPIVGDGQVPGGFIPWWLAEIAHASYRAQMGGAQSLERLAERGGFGWFELGILLAGRKWLLTSEVHKGAVKALTDAWAKRSGATP